MACKSCHKVKQRCKVVWGELAVEGSRAIVSGFPAFGGEGIKLLERLVVGVEKMGSEMVKVNVRLERIEGVLQFSYWTSYLFFPLLSYYTMLSSPDLYSFSHDVCLTHFSVVILFICFLKGPFTDSRLFTL